jgi:glycerol-3-phosphate acyltransferase PlsX
VKRGRASAPPTAPLIALDVMGGDAAPDVMVAGGLRAHAAGLSVVLVGDNARIAPLLPTGAAIGVLHAPEALEMHDAPTAVRGRPECAPRVALRAVAQGRAAAAVSCGNTGATMVSAMLELPSVPGITRPAVAVLLPRSDGGRLILLDAGANADCRPEHLVGFAALGAAYARALGVPTPRVGVLSNGHEAGKGTALTRATLAELDAAPDAGRMIVGNMEPHAALAGGCDVLVCDGFVGNVLLKGVEAAAETVVALLKQEVARRMSARIGAALLVRSLGAARDRIAWSAQGGALLLGVRGVVVVGHGRADAAAVHAAVRLAHDAASAGLVEAVDASFPAT